MFRWSVSSDHYLILGWVILAISNIIFVTSGSPYPRPLWYFTGISASLFFMLLCFVRPVNEKYSTKKYLLSVLFLSLNFRISGYYRVIVSGGDYQRWLDNSMKYIHKSSIVGEGMYADSPFYILFIVINKLVNNVGIFDIRYILIAVSVLLPLFVYVLTRTVTGDPRTGIVASVLTVPFPLFLRTASLLESEVLAIGWFTLSLYLLYRSLDAPTFRSMFLLTIYTYMSVWLHFFYSFIIITVLSSIIYVSYFVNFILVRTSEKQTLMSTNYIEQGVNRGHIVYTFLVGVFLTYHVISSRFNNHAVGALYSLINIELKDSLLSYLIPSGDTVAKSVGTTTQLPTSVRLIKFVPFIVLLILSLSYSVKIYQRLKNSRFELYMLSTVLAITLFTLVASLSHNLQYRMYYFISIPVIVISSRLVSEEIGRSDLFGSIKKFTIVFLLASYVIAGPVTPLGNNVDSPIGETLGAGTTSEYEQINRFDDLIEGDSPIPIWAHDFIWVFSPSGQQRDEGRYITDQNCRPIRDTHNKIWSTGHYHVCDVSYIPNHTYESDTPF